MEEVAAMNNAGSLRNQVAAVSSPVDSVHSLDNSTPEGLRLLWRVLCLPLPGSSS